MKELKKYLLTELEDKMPVLDTVEQSAIIGGDKFYFNASGMCYNIEEAEGPDEIIADGAKSGYVIESGSLRTSGVNINGQSGIRIDGGDKNLFKYLADNTDVEWGMNYNDNGDNPDGTIYSNFGASHIEFLAEPGFDSFVHSHPGGTESESQHDSDIKALYGRRGKYKDDYDYKYFSIYGRNEYGDEFEEWY